MNYYDTALIYKLQYMFFLVRQFLKRWSRMMSGCAHVIWIFFFLILIPPYHQNSSHPYWRLFAQGFPWFPRWYYPLAKPGRFVRVPVAGYGLVPVIGRLHRWHMWCQLRTWGSAGRFGYVWVVFRCHPASSWYARLLIDPNLNYPQLILLFTVLLVAGTELQSQSSKLKTWTWRIFNFLCWECDGICCQVASVRIANGADELLVLGTDGRKYLKYFVSIWHLLKQGLAEAFNIFHVHPCKSLANSWSRVNLRGLFEFCSTKEVATRLCRAFSTSQ